MRPNALSFKWVEPFAKGHGGGAGGKGLREFSFSKSSISRATDSYSVSGAKEEDGEGEFLSPREGVNFCFTF